MPANRIRFHKGISRVLRNIVRERFGIALDEEAAQFALSGFSLAMDHAGQNIEEAVAFALNLERRDSYMRTWESEYPDKNPYPPPFPARVLAQIERIEAVLLEDPSREVGPMLVDISAMCHEELKIDTFKS